MPNKQQATKFLQESTNKSVNGNSVYRLRRAQNKKQYLFASFLKTAQGEKVYTLDFTTKKQDVDWYSFKNGAAIPTIANTKGSGLLPFTSSQAAFVFNMSLERNKLFYIETDVLSNTPVELVDA